jgi:hypothetical protein
VKSGLLLAISFRVDQEAAHAMGTRRLRRREVHFGRGRAHAASVKLGHPVPLSNSSKDAKSGSQETST